MLPSTVLGKKAPAHHCCSHTAHMGHQRDLAATCLGSSPCCSAKRLLCEVEVAVRAKERSVRAKIRRHAATIAVWAKNRVALAFTLASGPIHQTGRKALVRNASPDCRGAAWTASGMRAASDTRRICLVQPTNKFPLMKWFAPLSTTIQLE